MPTWMLLQNLLVSKIIPLRGILILVREGTAGWLQHKSQCKVWIRLAAARTEVFASVIAALVK